MQTLRPEIEHCRCRVCRSDLAYILTCELRDSIEFTIIEEKKDAEKGVTSAVKASPKGPFSW